MGTLASPPTTAQRWWTYQRERFPLAAHLPLIAVFSLSALLHSAWLRTGSAHLGWADAAGAVGLAFGFFLLLRIADEFKDAAKDAAHRPYRPVPRGLVSLRELGAVGVVTAALQLIIALALGPGVTVVLLIGWAYFGLMTVEFFVPTWLEARASLYMASHMLILPLIALTVTACDWAGADAVPPLSLGWFLAATYASGLGLELGRKIRAPEDEEPGVQTYSVRWGRRGAVGAWCVALTGAAGLAVVAAHQVDAGGWTALVSLPLVAAAWGVGLRFLREPTSNTAAAIEPLAGLGFLTVHACMGVLPLVVG